MSVRWDDYKWHFDYRRLIGDAGFAFTRKRLQNIDKSKLASIDIDTIVRDRDIGIVEKYIPIIVEFVLDPEQTELLDSSFVKIFQMSQLCVEYLLYCKKHLDNTVYLLKEDYKKLQNENRELNEFAEELKLHIARLTTDLKPSSIFKCNECMKLFSTEEYLSAHIKRRHSTIVQNDTISNEADNDRLHSEIKELKGRLNSTEKLICEYQNELKSAKETKSSDLLNDIQQKFDSLRLEIERELKNLQTHYNFEEKCEKFFGAALENIEQLRSRKNEEIEQIKVKREITTQTEDLMVPIIQPDEKIDETYNTEKQIKEIGDNLDTKLTLSLQKFWEKLDEIEEICKRRNEAPAIPVVKPRTKLTASHMEEQSVNVEKSPIKARQRQRWVKHDNPKDKPPIVEVACDFEDNESESDEIVASPPPKIEDIPNKSPECDEELEKEENPLQKCEKIEESPVVVENPIRVDEHEESPPLPQVQPQTLDLVKRTKESHKTDKKCDLKPVIDEEILANFQPEIEELVNRRLQDFGISPEWKGIPMKTYQKVTEIIEHQASLMKKSLPNFDRISKMIDKEINKKIDETQGRSRHNQRKDVGNHKKFTKSVQRTPTRAAAQVEIKNRKLYDSDDSESTDGKLDAKPTTRYSAVIEELKNKSKLLDTDQTRGVLKNYPSDVSLTKKRVNFDLNYTKPISSGNRLRDGGSTTSIGSSVLDATPRKFQINEIVEFSDLSDL